MRADGVGQRIHDIFHHGLKAPAPLPMEAGAGMMPLAEAAGLYQDTQRGTDLHRFSAGLAENDDVLLAFWACRLADTGIAIYGTRVMAAKSEIVPIEAMRSGTLIHRATRLARHTGHGLGDFCDLKVKRQDLATLAQPTGRLRPTA